MYSHFCNNGKSCNKGTKSFAIFTAVNLWHGRKNYNFYGSYLKSHEMLDTSSICVASPKVTKARKAFAAVPGFFGKKTFANLHERLSLRSSR
jgi:hypothetical protein